MWELLGLFLNEKEIMGCAEGTIRYYRRHLGIAFNVMGVRDVKDWTSDNINALLLAKSKTCNTAGLHAHFRAVRAFSKWLYLRERIEKDVMRHVASPKTPKANPNPFSMDEVRRVLAVCKKRRLKHRALALVTLALDTGECRT